MPPAAAACMAASVRRVHTSKQQTNPSLTLRCSRTRSVRSGKDLPPEVLKGLRVSVLVRGANNVPTEAHAYVKVTCGGQGFKTVEITGVRAWGLWVVQRGSSDPSPPLSWCLNAGTHSSVPRKPI